ncbi:MAG: TIR domain-containing protein [Verrucomicrobiota bacterium]|nr:TIR domain-containing protein [Verrucomicrobiota bacterium]MEC8244127.1 TIR domain-containing protein [Verrucomicrobiota bacterium]
MPKSFKYKAFISYSHHDKKAVDWLHKKLETYRIPRSLVGKKTQSGEIQKRLYPIFRDREELPTANELASVIKNALEESSHLIVICSPNSAKSKWVNEEIKYFKQLGRSGNIFCFIIGGIPNISETGRPDPQECFPDAVRYEIDKDGNLTSNPIEPIAADCRDERDGKKNAIIKLIAGLIGVGFDQLKQRDLARNQKKLLGLSTFSLALVAIMSALTLRALEQQTEAEKQKINAISAQIVAEKARDEESFQREKAERAQYISSQLQREAEWKSYVYQINLANSKINQGDIVTAENILWNTNPKFRNWEWGRLILDADRSLLTVNLHEKEEYFHSGHVESGVFSPDGKKFLAAGSGGQIKIWHTATGKIIKSFNEGKTIFRKVAFSPDGSTFISSPDYGPVRIWAVESGEEYPSISLSNDKKDKIVHISYFGKGKQIAIGTNNGAVSFYDLKNGKELREILFPDTRLNYFDFSPNETKMVTSHSRGTFNITHLAGGNTQTFPIHNERANVLFSIYAPKGGNIFSTNSMRSLIFWDPINQEFSYQTSGQFKDLVTASYSPNGNFLATACSDGTVQLWDNWKKQLISNTRTHALSLTGIDFHPDNKRFLTTSQDGRIRVWARQPDNNILNLEPNPYVREASVSPDNSMILLVGKKGKEIDLWDAKKNLKVLSFSEGHSAQINFTSFSPCGERFISVSDDMTSCLWNIKDRKIIYTLRGHQKKVNFATFSPDGKMIATTSADKSVIIWDAESSKQITTLQHDDSVILASFDPKGEKLVTCDENQKTIVWDLDKLKIISVGPNALNSLTFSPDGKNVLSTSRYSKIAKTWNPNSGRVKFALKGHLSSVNSAYYSSDGQRIITTSNDDTIRIWDAKKGDELLSLNFGRCDFARFFPDGKSIIVHRKYGKEKGINLLKALNFSFDRSQYENHKNQRYLKWQMLNNEITNNTERNKISQ